MRTSCFALWTPLCQALPPTHHRDLQRAYRADDVEAGVCVVQLAGEAAQQDEGGGVQPDDVEDEHGSRRPRGEGEGEGALVGGLIGWE